MRWAVLAACLVHAGCANDASGQCARAASRLEGCSTYCTTDVACDAPVVCQLAPIGCNARWAECQNGRFVVSSTGHACPDGGASIDASGP